MLSAGALDRLRNTPPEARKSRRVAAGVWHTTEEAIESVIVSDQFEQLIFLIRFPSATCIDHEEEPESDTFTDLIEQRDAQKWKL
jgi:hypothetical protein